MSEPYEDLGGQRGDAYSDTGALQRLCSTCGAQPGQKCTYESTRPEAGRGMVTRTRTRHMPCVARIAGGNRS